MRKKIIVGLSVLILIFNCTVERPKANAAVGFAAISAAGGLESGALAAMGAAAAPYVIGGLIIAAGGAAAYEGIKNRDLIAKKASSIYGSLSQSAKDSFNASINASLKAGRDTVTFGSAFLDEFKSNAATVGSAIKSLFYSTEAVPMSSDYGDINSDTYIFSPNRDSLNIIGADSNYGYGTLRLSDDRNYNLFINGDHTGAISMSYVGKWTGSNTLQLTYRPIIGYKADGSNIYGDFVTINTLYTINTVPQPFKLTTVLGFMNAVSNVFGCDVSIVPSLSKTSISGTSVDSYVDHTLSGFKEIDLPLDTWLTSARDANGQPLSIDRATGTYVDGSGVPYTGSIDYDIPGLPDVSVPDYVDLSNPTMPIDDVFTSTDADTGAGAGTGEGALTDVVTGIRDFVGDIAKGIGAITGTLAHPVGDVSKIEWDKLKVSAEGITTAFPFSLPWDIKRAITNITVDGQKPKFKFEIKIAGHLYSADVSIPTMFDRFVPIIRGFFVLIFIIGLIWATRSLFGGSI